MSNQRPDRTRCGALSHLEQERLSRRDVLRGTAAISAGAAAFELASGTVFAQGATAATSGVTVDQLMALSARLVGGGNLNADFGQPLLDLLNSNPTWTQGLQELLAAGSGGGTPTPPSAAASQAASAIVSYWCLGEVDGKPVANRQELFFGLVAWQTLPYVTIQTLCKKFGYWAEPVQVNAKPS